MTSKRNVWLSDKETVVKSVSVSFIDHKHVTSIHVMHRRKKNPKTEKVHHYGWIHFGGTGHGVIEGNARLRKLAHAILKSIGDEP
jgi:hypothetical protein